MNLETILAKLKEAKQLLTKELPANLRDAGKMVADTAKRVQETLDQAATFLENLGTTGPIGVLSADDQEKVVELVKLRDECAALCGPYASAANEGEADASLGPVGQAALAWLIKRAIDRLLKRLQPTT